MATVEIQNYRAGELSTELGIIGYAVMPGRLIKKNKQKIRQLIIAVPSESRETEEMREKAQRAIDDYGGKIVL